MTFTLNSKAPFVFGATFVLSTFSVSFSYLVLAKSIDRFSELPAVTLNDHFAMLAVPFPFNNVLYLAIPYADISAIAAIISIIIIYLFFVFIFLLFELLDCFFYFMLTKV